MGAQSCAKLANSGATLEFMQYAVDAVEPTLTTTTYPFSLSYLVPYSFLTMHQELLFTKNIGDLALKGAMINYYRSSDI